MEKQTFNPAPANRPSWWNDQYTSDWDRVKEALRRDWEQTKADFKVGGAVDLNQNVVDTVKQAVGEQPVPPPAVKTRADTPAQVADRVEDQMKARLEAQEKFAEARTDAAVERVRAEAKVAEAQRDWARAEEAMRYGFGARRQYADERVWDDRFESRLRHEWTELKNGTTWEEARPYVRQGWDYGVQAPTPTI